MARSQPHLRCPIVRAQPTGPARANLGRDLGGVFIPRSMSAAASKGYILAPKPASKITQRALSFGTYYIPGRREKYDEFAGQNQ
jgi:hypothetical protein